MLNFTGQTKKRTVNLGDRKSVPRGRNFLEQTKLQRQQREELRTRERSAALIQRYIRRWQELLDVLSEFVGGWDEDGDWNVRAVQLGLYSRYCSRLAPVGQVVHKLVVSLGGQLGERAVLVTYALINRLLRNGRDERSLVASLYLLLVEYGAPQVPNEAFRGIIRRLQMAEECEEATKCIFLINSADPDGQFLSFLAAYRPAAADTELANVASSAVLATDHNVLLNLSNQQKVALLVSVITLQGEDVILPSAYHVHARILSTMSTVALTSEEPEDEEYGPPQKQTLISREDMDAVLNLYTSKYVSLVMNQLVSVDVGGHDANVAMQTIATLMHLVQPPTKLCMLITITPGSHKRFFQELNRDPIFKHFLEAENSRDYLLGDEIEQYRSLLSNSMFWNTLYTFQEIMSYWLFVSNDLESFSEEKISKAEAVVLSKFLKILTLTLIFNTNKPDPARVFGDIQKLKASSLNLLNLLYFKNLRIKFLPEAFWKLKHLNFDIDSMIVLVLDDQMSDSHHDDDYDSETEHTVPQVRSKRTNDAIAKLEVLDKVSYFIDFKDRVKVFQSIIESDRQNLPSNNAFGFFMENPPLRFEADISRGSVLEDAFKNFYHLGHKFKERISVTFHSEHGPEAGIDGGGITKEFLTSVAMEGFDPNLKQALFKESPANNELYPNDDIYMSVHEKLDLKRQQERLLYIQFLGMTIGKCFYENVLIDIEFAPFFLTKWTSALSAAKNSVNDLQYLDVELYHNLMKLLEMSESEIKALDLNFTINEVVQDRVVKFDLQPPHGESVSVTTTNRLNYIHEVANFKLNQCLYLPSKHFLEGLHRIIDRKWLNMFDPFELQMLISGGEVTVNVEDWKNNVNYGGYFDDDITVKYFWEVVEEMDSEERGRLIKFVTSVSKAPLLGFGSLSPRFGIRNSGRYPDRLPTASTCVNLLKLPDYQDKKLVREKLLYAINVDSGFDLS